jgi:hypothetical protein
MTTETVREGAAFPTIVTAAFFVRNAGVLATLLLLLIFAA